VEEERVQAVYAEPSTIAVTEDITEATRYFATPWTYKLLFIPAKLFFLLKNLGRTLYLLV
jgi:hypothetical protein